MNLISSLIFLEMFHAYLLSFQIINRRKIILIIKFKIILGILWREVIEEEDQ